MSERIIITGRLFAMLMKLWRFINPENVTWEYKVLRNIYNLHASFETIESL